MNDNKRELVNARKKANEDKKQAALPPPPVDNRVKFVTYTNQDGETRRRHCQDFKVIANDVNGCAIMWLGDIANNDPNTRTIVGQTFGIRKWSVERLDQTWEEYEAGE